VVKPDHAYASLNPTQARTLTAIFERMFPADARDPGATEIGVVEYLDRALAGIYRHRQETYRLGLKALDASSTVRTGLPFADLDSALQDQLLGDLQQGTLENFQSPDQGAFFLLMRTHLLEGLFSDPLYGGNRDKLGWKFLRHPGAWLDYSESESMSDEPAEKGGEYRSLADHEAANPPPVREPAIANFDPQRAASPSFEPADVIIVGVGAMGGMTAPIFARAGLRVVALEAGPWRSESDFRPDELSLAFYTRANLSTKFMREAPRWRREPSEPTDEATFSLGRMSNGVGGSILQYGTWLRRFHPHHFRPLSHVREKWGLSALPATSTLADWPITYDDLDSYYSQVERIIGIAGDDKNPFIPRSQPLPMPPLREFRMGQAFSRVAETMGLHPTFVPVGTNSIPYDGRPAMKYSGWTSTLHSSAGDRWHPGLNTIPEALATGNFDLRTHCRVIRVITDSTGRATGVEYVDPNGDLRTQLGRTVILAGYTFENARLMWLSGDARHPSGLGNSTSQLGRNLMVKMFSDINGFFPDRIFNRHTGPAAQSMIVDDFLAESFDSGSAGFLGGATLSAENSGLPLSIAKTSVPDNIQRWGLEFKSFLREWQHVGSIRIQPDALPYRENYFDLDPWHRDRSGLGLPVVRLTYDLRPNEHRLAAWMEEKSEAILTEMGAAWTWRGPRFTGVCSSHDLGGLRMGEDPSASVLSPELAVHDTPGLYAFTGGAFPSCPGINPTLTMMAMASRAADRLVERLRRGEEP
jgi:gluconate 2-dehydrogenase alpha chain